MPWPCSPLLLGPPPCTLLHAPNCGPPSSQSHIPSTGTKPSAVAFVGSSCMSCSCSCNTAAIVCSNLLLLSHSASDVMLELLSKLSVPIMPSSCHAMDAMHQVSAMQASPSFMGPCHFNDCDSCSQAACLSHFLALTLVHERHCRMRFIRVESHQPDLICIIQGGSAGSGNACSSSGAV